MDPVTAAKIGITVVKNRKHIGKILLACFVVIVFLASVPTLLVNSIGENIMNTIDNAVDGITGKNKFDLAKTKSYEILGTALAAFKESMRERLQSRANEIRENNKEWVDGDENTDGYYKYRVEPSIALTDADISVLYAYFSTSNTAKSTEIINADGSDGIERGQDNAVSLVPDLDKVNAFLESICSIEEYWEIDSKVIVYNKFKSADEIIVEYFQDDSNKALMFGYSKMIFEMLLADSSIPTATGTVGGIGIPGSPGVSPIVDIQLYPNSIMSGVSPGFPAENFQVPQNGSNNAVVYFSQSGHQPWSDKPFGGGTIATSGCSVTCLAMCLSYETGSMIYPNNVVDNIATHNRGNYNQFYTGDGQSWSIFSKVASYYGMQAHELAKASVKQILRSGHPVIASCRPGSFTKHGHFIVITGIDSSGNVYVNDPNSNHKHYSAVPYNFDVIADSQFKGYWYISR